MIQDDPFLTLFVGLAGYWYVKIFVMCHTWVLQWIASFY